MQHSTDFNCNSLYINIACTVVQKENRSVYFIFLESKKIVQTENGRIATCCLVNNQSVSAILKVTDETTFQSRSRIFFKSFKAPGESKCNRES